MRQRLYIGGNVWGLKRFLNGTMGREIALRCPRPRSGGATNGAFRPSSANSRSVRWTRTVTSQRDVSAKSSLIAPDLERTLEPVSGFWDDVAQPPETRHMAQKILVVDDDPIMHRV